MQLLLTIKWRNMAKLHTPEYGILLVKVGHREGPLYMKGKFQYQYQDQYFEIPDFNINMTKILFFNISQYIVPPRP